MKDIIRKSAGVELEVVCQLPPGYYLQELGPSNKLKILAISSGFISIVYRKPKSSKLLNEVLPEAQVVYVSGLPGSEESYIGIMRLGVSETSGYGELVESDLENFIAVDGEEVGTTYYNKKYASLIGEYLPEEDDLEEDVDDLLKKKNRSTRKSGN